MGKAAEQSISPWSGTALLRPRKQAETRQFCAGRRDFTGSQPGLEDNGPIGRIRYLARANVFMRLKAAALAPACNGEEKIDERAALPRSSLHL